MTKNEMAKKIQELELRGGPLYRWQIKYGCDNMEEIKATGWHAYRDYFEFYDHENDIKGLFFNVHSIVRKDRVK